MPPACRRRAGDRTNRPTRRTRTRPPTAACAWSTSTEPALLKRITDWVGPLPARRVAWILAISFSAWIVLDVLVFQLSIGLSRPSYDAMVRARAWAAPPDP